jgi:hypothetical protein
MFFADRLTLDAPKRTRDGYLAVRAKAARTGVFDYAGSEVDPNNEHGLRDKAVVKVLRDAATVFDTAAVHSFIGKPITDDHPREAVTSGNWRDHARGTIMGAKWEEGGYLAFDLLLTDAEAIAKVDAGKRELSNGYGAELEFGDFTAPDGTVCDARQKSIVGNHVALVDRGRAGPACAITDAKPCASIPSDILDSLKEKPVKTMLIDGLTVDVSNADTAEATIKTLLAARDAATGTVKELQDKAVADAAATVAKDAEIEKLKKDLADAKLTPAQMREAGKAYAAVCDKAKAMGVTVTDAMDEAAIRRAVVDKAMGDKAKDYSDEHVAIAFDVVTKDAKVAEPGVQPLGKPTNVTDGKAEVRAARATWLADKQNSFRTAGNA